MAIPATGATRSTDLQELAVTIREIYRTYVAFHSDLERAESGTLTLWTMHTHVFDVAEFTPYLMVTAPTAAAGKSRIFDVARLLVREAFPVIDPSPASLFRTIDALHPTVLIDEADMITESAQLRSVLNAGVSPGNRVSRATRDGGLEYFDVFCPKAFAGIAHGRPPITNATLTRCIQIPMRRRADHEPIAKFRRREAMQYTVPVKREIEKWALQARSFLDGGSAIRMPEGLTDRQEDSWEPLVEIADMIGPEWAHAARQWAVELSRAIPREPDIGVQLLRDVKRVLDRWPGNRIPTRALANGIKELEGREYEDDLSPNQLARRLGGFGLHADKSPFREGGKGSPTVRGFTFRRGRKYTHAWADAFTRYGVE